MTTTLSVRAQALTALRTVLAALDGVGEGQQWPILAPNRGPTHGWKPQPTDYFIEEYPQGDDSIDIATSGGLGGRWRQVTGMYQWNLAFPDGSGVKNALALADAIEHAFLTTAMALPDGTPVIVSEVRTQPMRQNDVDPWARLPVVITYYIIVHP